MAALKKHLADVLARRQEREAKHLAGLVTRRSMQATQRALEANAGKPGSMPGTATRPNPPKG